MTTVLYRVEGQENYREAEFPDCRVMLTWIWALAEREKKDVEVVCPTEMDEGGIATGIVKHDRFSKPELTEIARREGPEEGLTLHDFVCKGCGNVITAVVELPEAWEVSEESRIDLECKKCGFEGMGMV